NRFFIGYCFLISIRFVGYSLALRYSLEPILRWDRLFATISPNGVFVNQYASLCWSMAALYGAFHQYVFFLRPDSVMFELYAYFLGLKRNFVQLNPQFKIRLSSDERDETVSYVHVL